MPDPDIIKALVPAFIGLMLITTGIELAVLWAASVALPHPDDPETH